MAPLPARFCVALLQLYRAFYYHLGPFHPREPLPGRGGLGVVCAGSEPLTKHKTECIFIKLSPIPFEHTIQRETVATVTLN